MKNNALSGICSENFREIIQLGEKSAGARRTYSLVEKQSNAAGRLVKEDDIRNECNVMENKSENIEDKNHKHEINEDKTMKLTKKEVKKNKTISKIKT